ncbi:protein neprosin-like [Lycium ferocissimum]|uniref:protein neprosin-like n=1 Tax=Lycium ferocissimum TaxID=112874 RepID=UPI002814B9C4|nr:protein neprosin-like [Lycium ferocissimum]
MQINRRIIQQTLLVLYFLLSYTEVQGEIKLSEVEDQELERQLKLLNKPAITTIKTKYGDIYDCVDFYKQPAFDHPSLKNHNFHPKMKPTLPRIMQTSVTPTTNKSSTIWLNDRGCPLGSVPIKRVTKDDLIRQRLMPPPEDVALYTQFGKTSNHSSELKRRFLSAKGYRVAIVSTPNDPKNKFGGAGMTATIWKPYVKDIMQVDPTLYGDSKTRRFIHFQAGKKHCFNTLCPGFVLVDNQLPIEAPFTKTSRRGDPKHIFEYPMYIDRDLVNGNWWVLLEETHKELGFWPQHIFTDLATFATNIEWGGMAYSPANIPEPPMGSGFFPVRKFQYDASCRKIIVLNYKGETIDVTTTPHSDNPNFYKVFDLPNGINEMFKHIIFYGGPGSIDNS